MQARSGYINSVGILHFSIHVTHAHRHAHTHSFSLSLSLSHSLSLTFTVGTHTQVHTGRQAEERPAKAFHYTSKPHSQYAVQTSKGVPQRGDKLTSQLINLQQCV